MLLGTQSLVASLQLQLLWVYTGFIFYWFRVFLHQAIKKAAQGGFFREYKF